MSDQPADDAVASARLVVAYVSEDDELDQCPRRRPRDRPRRRQGDPVRPRLGLGLRRPHAQPVGLPGRGRPVQGLRPGAGQAGPSCLPAAEPRPGGPGSTPGAGWPPTTAPTPCGLPRPRRRPDPAPDDLEEPAWPSASRARPWRRRSRRPPRPRPARPWSWSPPTADRARRRPPLALRPDPVQVTQAADLPAVVGVVVDHRPQDPPGRPPSPQLVRRGSPSSSRRPARPAPPAAAAGPPPAGPPPRPPWAARPGRGSSGGAPRTPTRGT